MHASSRSEVNDIGKGIVEKCATVLKDAKSDNEKLAGLLLFAKLRHGVQFDAAGKRQLFNAITFRFLRRLINCDSIPEGCDLDSYKAVAFAVLAFFASENSGLIGTEELCQILPGVKQLLSDRAGFEDVTGHEQVLEDCFSCILSVIKADPNKGYLSRTILPILCKVCLEPVPSIYSKKALVILTSWFGSGGWSQFDDSQLSLLLAAFSHQVIVLQDETKFTLCQNVYAILTSVPSGLLQRFCTETADQLLPCLSSLLENKLVAVHRQSALKLIICLLLLRGFGKILEQPSGEKKFLLIIHLSSIEVRLALEAAEDNSLGTTIADLVCCCLQLMEQIIIVIVKQSDLIKSPENFLSMHKAIGDSVTAVLNFLGRQQKEEELVTMDGKTLAATFAMVRFVGAWLSEETAAHADQVAQVLRSLLMISHFSLSKGQDIFKFMLHGLRLALQYDAVYEIMLVAMDFMTEYASHVMKCIFQAANVMEMLENEKILCQWCDMMLDLFPRKGVEFRSTGPSDQSRAKVFDLLVCSYPLLTQLLHEPEQKPVGRYDLCLTMGMLFSQVQSLLPANVLSKREPALAACNKELVYAVSLFHLYAKTPGRAGNLLITWLDTFNELSSVAAVNPKIYEIMIEDEFFIPDVINVLKSNQAGTNGARAIQSLFDTLMGSKDSCLASKARDKITSGKK